MDEDAWLDSFEVDQRFIGTAVNHNKDFDNEDDSRDLPSEELGVIKRLIANMLELGETVTQALRRLKGTINKKEKMPAETKRVFDHLIEDAMNLMEENGKYQNYLLSDAIDPGSASVLFSNSVKETFTANATATKTAPNANDAYDMFVDDDEDASAKASSDGLNTI
ncbi:CD2 antigen cytoplasmic tail-binding 2 [Melia azedarach]|uniref:CD2 antigen cytoplasmic tail-binding 2 n=1 Tax=Melia azedarach TaxID=155640 RepID=A0ACC1Y206_MELAZ|nr:CD2 antigen cytoplasmic tail-binding 2 [Melia azedarach]